MARRETAKVSHNFKICDEFMFFEFNLCYSMGQVMVWISWTPKIDWEILGFIIPCWTMINGFIRWKASLTIHQWLKLYCTRNYMTCTCGYFEPVLQVFAVLRIPCSSQMFSLGMLSTSESILIGLDQVQNFIVKSIPFHERSTVW